MNKNNIRRIVLSNFKDYPYKDIINKLIDEYMEESINNYDDNSNISKDIYVSMLINNKIYRKLLSEENIENMIYMDEKCQHILEIIKRIKTGSKQDVTNLKESYKIYDYVKNNYDASESFFSFVGRYINGYYNGLDEQLRKEEEEKEKKEEKEKNERIIMILENMKIYEKKLKFRF